VPVWTAPPSSDHVVAATPEYVAGYSMTSDNKGGGKAEMAQAGGTDPRGVERAFEKLYEVVKGA